jgi:shikimate dehydrogenase
MRIFGLIGKPLAHSFSPDFFNEKFERENLPKHQYRLFPLDAASEVISLVAGNPGIEGLNVTIPYKKEVMDYLDKIDPVAWQTGAVNTIKIRKKSDHTQLIGYNTDVFGFQHSCVALSACQGAIILGTGGAAQAVIHVLKQFSIPFVSVSRAPEKGHAIGYEDLNSALIRDHLLIVNTTPLGMFPDTENGPSFPYPCLTRHHFVYDLIYNPPETRFLRLARARGAATQNGRLMLELQAERSWEIWNE